VDGAIGQIFGGKYRILSEISRGGMGRIYRAEQLALGREVAIKVIMASDDPIANQRFLLEASLTAKLDDITMLDVHRALGENRIFALGPADPDPACLVEQAVNSSLESAMREAEALLLERLADVSLADIAADFDRRFAELLPDARPATH